MSSPFELTVIDPRNFEVIKPGHFIECNVQNPIQKCRWLHFPVLRIAVLDSPVAKANDKSPLIAAMIVPKNRETDWIFCTEPGHLQLIFNFPSVSRLILIGNMPPYLGPLVYKPGLATDPVIPVELQGLKNKLKPLLKPLHPKASSSNGSPKTPFLTYDQDDVVYRETVAKLVGPIVGEFLVEDVVLVGADDRSDKLRRRLRFKRMPNLIQSEVLLNPIIGDEVVSDDEATTNFEADTSILVHQYLAPMVAGLFLIASHLNKRIQQGFTPRALCLGIGGGVLLSFLDNRLGFHVTGLEADETVLTAAKKYFRFDESGSIRVLVGDAIESLQNLPLPKSEWDTNESKVDEDVPDAKLDVIFVDLDSSDAKNGFSAPPLEFVEKPVLEGLRSLLDDHGVLIINFLFLTLVNELEEFFHKIYKIDVGNQDNCVVMATVSPASSDYNDNDNEFLRKLNSVIPGTYINSIVEF